MFKQQLAFYYVKRYFIMFNPEVIEMISCLLLTYIFLPSCSCSESPRNVKVDVTFSNFGVDFKLVRGEDVVNPPCESPLLLFDPSLIVKHVLGSKWHRMSRYG